MRTLFLFSNMFFFVMLAQSQSFTTGLNFDFNRVVKNANPLRIAATTIDTLTLPFIDDFSTSEYSPDTSRWLNEGNVFVNNNFAVKPPSVNVATFDGIKDDGFPYIFPLATTNNSAASPRGVSDYLISKPIDLSEYDSLSNVAFSFYWQKGSHHPNHNPYLNEGDTLKLFFLNKDSVWVKAWPILPIDDDILINRGFGKNVFNYKYLPISDSSYFHDAFQFKFTSSGVLDGNFSIWSIDYVYLDSGRVTENIQDFAFGNQLTSLLGEFSAVPYTQYEASPFDYLSDTITTGYSNLSGQENFRDEKFVKVSTSSGASEVVFEAVTEGSGLPQGGTIPADTTVSISWTPNKQVIADAINAYGERNFELDYQMKLSGNDQKELLETNDSISQTNYLSNYFAYDDGTPEGGIVLNVAGYFKIAYEFEVKRRDTLTAIYIYWDRSGYDISGTSIKINIWKSLTGVKGATADEFYLNKKNAVITYDENFGGFTRILIPETIIEAGFFYVGWEQNVISKSVKFGADYSHDNRKRFYEHFNGKWDNPKAFNFYGTPMIRPKFGYGLALGMDDVTVGIEDEMTLNNTNKSINVYPNPADYEIIIDGACKSFQMFDVTGNVKLRNTFEKIKGETIIETHQLNPGIYFLQVSNGKFSQTKKVIIYH